MTLLPFASHPLVLLPLQLCLTAATVGFSSPRSPVRWFVFPIVTALAWSIVASSYERLGVLTASTYIGVSATTWLMQYIEIAFLSHWTFESYGPADTPKAVVEKAQSRDHDDTFWQRLRFGFYATFSHRCCGTPFEIKHVPPFSSTSPDWVPSRAEFLRSTLIKLIAIYLARDVAAAVIDPSFNPVHYASNKIPFFARLDEISLQEVIERIIRQTLILTQLSALLYSAVASHAFLSVLLGLSEPSWWRPLFGSPSEAYTVRRFWNRTWHQMYRTDLAHPWELLLGNVFGLSSDSILYRYGLVVLAMVYSGLFHIAEEVSWGSPVSFSKLFCSMSTQSLGIIIEDGFLAVWSRIFSDGSIRSRPKTWHKIIGYCWAILFLSWSLPAGFYPRIATLTGGPQDYLITFSIFKYLTSFRSA